MQTHISRCRLPSLIIDCGNCGRLIGLGTGYLTLRLRGAFFAIATLALAVVLQTFIVNWIFVGGVTWRLCHPAAKSKSPFFNYYIQYLFADLCSCWSSLR